MTPRSPEVIYYVACSLDGFIATPDGGVEWLAGVEVEGEDYGYAAFFDSVDGLLMGRATFEQALAFGPWPYGDKPCWVWTHRRIDAKPAPVIATREAPVGVVAQAARRGLRRLWLVGGGQVAGEFRRHALISRHVFSIVPMVLGGGVPLFAGGGGREQLTLEDTRGFPSGLVQLTYARGPARTGASG